MQYTGSTLGPIYYESDLPNPEKFYEEHISKRRPAVLKASQLSALGLGALRSLTPERLRSVAGEESVEIARTRNNSFRPSDTVGLEVRRRES